VAIPRVSTTNGTSFCREELRLDGFLGFGPRVVGLHRLKVSVTGGGKCGPGLIL
jgi:hypothetical protein